MDHEEYLRRIKSHMKTPTKEIEQQLQEFCDLCSYVSGQYDKDESFQNLNKHIEKLEHGRSETHRLFYMALPPSVFTIVSQHLKKCCYPPKGIARVVVSNTSFLHAPSVKCPPPEIYDLIGVLTSGLHWLWAIM
jgi:glucose-6-phosphate 1-dehydrogenase